MAYLRELDSDCNFVIHVVRHFLHTTLHGANDLRNQLYVKGHLVFNGPLALFWLGICEWDTSPVTNNTSGRASFSSCSQYQRSVPSSQLSQRGYISFWSSDIVLTCTKGSNKRGHWMQPRFSGSSRIDLSIYVRQAKWGRWPVCWNHSTLEEEAGGEQRWWNMELTLT